MKSSALLLALTTACGPGCSSYASNLFEREQDATLAETTPEETGNVDAGETRSLDSGSERSATPDSDAAQGPDNDAHADGGLDAFTPVVCSGIECGPVEGYPPCCSQLGTCGFRVGEWCIQ
jgi:hypothetical protein